MSAAATHRPLGDRLRGAFERLIPGCGMHTVCYAQPGGSGPLTAYGCSRHPARCAICPALAEEMAHPWDAAAAASVAEQLARLLSEGRLARMPFVTMRDLLEALAVDRTRPTAELEAAVRAWMDANHWQRCRYRMPFGRTIEWGYERPEVSARRDPRNKDASPLFGRAQALDGIDQAVERAVDGLDRIADVPLGHGARVLIRAGLHVHPDERRVPLGEPVAELLVDGVDRSVEVALSGDSGLRVELVQRGDSLHLHSGAPSVVVTVRGNHRRAEASTQHTPEGGAQ